MQRSIERAGQASPQGVESVPPAESAASDNTPPTAAPSTLHAVWDEVSSDSVIVIAPPSKEESELALKARTYYRRKVTQERSLMQSKGTTDAW